MLHLDEKKKLEEEIFKLEEEFVKLEEEIVKLEEENVKLTNERDYNYRRMKIFEGTRLLVHTYSEKRRMKSLVSKRTTES